MVTFEEFLVRFNEEVEETLEYSELSDTARAVVISTMKRYFRGKKYDPLELMAVFEGVCVATMTKDEPKRKAVLNRIKREANHYVTEEPDFTRFPDITFEEAEEMRAMGR